MRRAVLGLGLAGLLVPGCFASHPRGSTGFVHATSLAQFEGVYGNAGEVKEGPPTYLSALIWPHATGMDHRTITSIEVRASGERRLTVRARTDSTVVKEQTFVQGKDFDLHQGRLRIKHFQGLHANHNVEDPTLGYEGESVELGLDRKGQGKSRQTTDFAGVVYLVMPIALRMTDEARFLRIGD